MIDFGLVDFRDDLQTQFMETACGSTCYAAPELQLGDAYHGDKADVWSLGIVLFVLVSGFLPFDHDNELIISDMVINDPVRFPGGLSANLVNLLTHMLVKSPDERISLDSVLAHPWLAPIVGSAPVRPEPGSEGDPQAPTPSEVLERVAEHHNTSAADVARTSVDEPYSQV